MLEAVARLLYELAAARIQDVTNLGNTTAPVLRIRLDAHYDGIGRTVIAKTRPHPGAGWNTHPAFLENERRALEHLQRSGVRLTPRVLTGDEDLAILVMTDLGTGPRRRDEGPMARGPARTTWVRGARITSRGAVVGPASGL